MNYPISSRLPALVPCTASAILAICLAGLLPGRATAATAVLTPGKDNTLYGDGTANLSSGAGGFLFAGKSGQGRVMRSLLAFDLVGRIPAGATINSVSLTFGVNTPHNNANTVMLRRVLADWGEGTSVAPSGGGGGAAATTGDATWNARFFNTTAWTTPGGDFSSAASVSQPVAGTSGTVIFASSGMAADVQAWLDNPAANFGWIMTAQDETLLAVRFSSREGSLPPSLQVTFTPAATGVAPAISAQPVSQTVFAGGSATLSVVASGTPVPTHQWRKGGVNIAGATNATFLIANAQASDAGSYDVVVINSAGSATSNATSISIFSGTVTATHAVVGAGYPSGGTVTIANSLTYTGSAAGIRWQALLPSGWSYTSGSGIAGSVKPTVGSTDLLEWAWTSNPVSPVTFTYTLNVPAGQTGDKLIAALVNVRLDGVNGELQLVAKNDPLIVSQGTNHSADTDRNFRLSLLEVTRVIELYVTRNGTTRTGCYRVQNGTEDGFNPDPATASGATVTLTRNHSADSDRDGRISLLELTRVIELYNIRSGTVRTGQYHVQPGTEDGFAPGP